MTPTLADIAVAMSGGVDSTMAAALLKEEGWKVQGLHLRLPAPPEEARRRSAAAVDAARRLEISLEMLDMRGPFERLVIRPFVNAYARGRTPNPCVVCNEAVKFRALLDFAAGRGIEAVATGHYAVVERRGSGPPVLRRGRDLHKEQSYFLHRLPQEVLVRAVFPLGTRSKEDVRNAAGDMGLAGDGRESQEVCFVKKGGYRRFVASGAGAGLGGPGAIVDLQGRVVGGHAGIHRYTVGQRRGLGIASPRPYFVRGLEPSANRVVVGRKEDLFFPSAEAEDVHWLAGEPPPDGTEVVAQIRYRHKAAGGRLRVLSRSDIRVEFREPQWAVTPGQALVCYAGDRVLGGGWIRRPQDSEKNPSG